VTKINLFKVVTKISIANSWRFSVFLHEFPEVQSGSPSIHYTSNILLWLYIDVGKLFGCQTKTKT
jgi:hypothetical protein